MTETECKKAYEEGTWLVATEGHHDGHRTELVKIDYESGVGVCHIKNSDGMVWVEYIERLRPATAKDILELGPK
jgi:hypothetical protein